jgi:hypothetical protein
MTSEPQTVHKLPLRFILYHPIAFLVSWALGVAAVSKGILDNTPLYVPPFGAKPFGAVVIGLSAGLALVAAESWRVRQHFDATVRAAALSAPAWPRSWSAIALVIAAFVASDLVDGLVLGPAGANFYLLLCGCWLLPLPLFYHTYRPVGEHAARLQAETSAGATGAPAISVRSNRRVGIWLDVIVALSIAGALAAGAWLQWAAPRMVPT